MAVALLAGSLLLSGCESSESSESTGPGADRAADGAEPQRTPPAPSFPGWDLPDDPADLGDLCEDRDLDYRTQTEYAGTGPHPIVIGGAVQVVVLSEEAFPAEWTPETASEVVLVGCAYETLGDVELRTCDYTLGTSTDPPRFPLRVPLYHREVTILVWELRTWELVETVKFETAGDDCPETAILGQEVRAVGAVITAAELTAALEGVVTGAVP
ncbi:hypothetical protein [Micromonospora sp. LOL_021]|uniref:hypothetical protein n=1 Tax=Micromonospora sp. LOL_021 TaxID=3345417 RepID=UPI003A853526